MIYSKEITQSERESMQPILKAHKLTKYRGEQQVLHEVSLNLHAGECLSLMGENGAGKTTLCEILLGLIPQDQGSVEILGYNMSTSRAKILPQIGVTLQETSLYKRYTVEETLNLFASFYNKVPCYKDILETLHLGHLLNKLLHQLSGGEKQKVYLATALLHRPKILFLDEPTAGLDLQSRESIWQMLHTMKEQGCAILLTTHHTEEAEQVSDSLAMIHRGKILASGTTHALTQKHATHITLILHTYTPQEQHKTDDPHLQNFIDQVKQHPGTMRYEHKKDHRLIFILQDEACMYHAVQLIKTMQIPYQKMLWRRGNLVDVYTDLQNKIGGAS